MSSLPRWLQCTVQFHKRLQIEEFPEIITFRTAPYNYQEPSIERIFICRWLQWIICYTTEATEEWLYQEIKWTNRWKLSLQWKNYTSQFQFQLSGFRSKQMTVFERNIMNTWNKKRLHWCCSFLKPWDPFGRLVWSFSSYSSSLSASSDLWSEWAHFFLQNWSRSTRTLHSSWNRSCPQRAAFGLP